MVDGTGLKVMQGVLDAHTFMGTFTDPGTRGITGLVGDKTFLIVFDRSQDGDEWETPQDGAIYTMRPVHTAFYNRRTVNDVAYIGYRATLGPSGRLSHDIVLWDGKRNMIRSYTDVTGLRKEN